MPEVDLWNPSPVDIGGAKTKIFPVTSVLMVSAGSTFQWLQCWSVICYMSGCIACISISVDFFGTVSLLKSHLKFSTCVHFQSPLLLLQTQGRRSYYYSNHNSFLGDKWYMHAFQVCMPGLISVNNSKSTKTRKVLWIPSDSRCSCLRCLLENVPSSLSVHWTQFF